MSIPNAPFGILPNAPMQTQLVDGQRSVTPSWGGWLNFLRAWLFFNIPTIVPVTINSQQVFVSADPIVNGAFGDGIHDDTAIVQQTITNSGGVLYLRPNKRFLLSSTITAPTPNNIIFIYGGGQITSSASTIISIPSGSGNWLIQDIMIVSTTSGATAISAVSNGGQQAGIRKCWMSGPAAGASVGVALNGNQPGIVVSGCFFINWGTAIGLTSQSDVMISDCEVFNGTPVSTSGTCTYNLRNGNPGTPDTYPTAQTAATAVAGGGQALPATVKTYITVNVVLAGVLTPVKIPAFSP